MQVLSAACTVEWYLSLGHPGQEEADSRKARLFVVVVVV